jgi:hypothetical protein
MGVKWSLTLREEHRLNEFEGRVMRGISGPEGNEITGGWINCHIQELHKFSLR